MSKQPQKKSVIHPSDRKAPADLDDFFNWRTNRRAVLKAALVAGTLSQLSFLQSCSSQTALENGNDFMSARQMTILKSVLGILFPDDGNGPSIDDLHTLDYILWVLGDPGANQTHKDYLIEGIDWADEIALERSGRNYLDLDQIERERAVLNYSQTPYGKEWCSIMMTLILESLLLDPIYGGNVNEAGWKWLNHVPGFPRPDERTRYENVVATTRSEYQKSQL